MSIITELFLAPNEFTGSANVDGERNCSVLKYRDVVVVVVVVVVFLWIPIVKV